MDRDEKSHRSRFCEEHSDKSSKLASRVHTFGFKPEGSTVTLSMEITGLQFLEKRSIVEWVRELKLVADTCQWTESTTLATIKAIVVHPIRKVIDACTSVDDAAEKLIGEKYPAFDSYAYSEQLDTIKQSDFVSIANYENKVRSLYRKYCHCTGEDYQLSTRRLTDYFFKGFI